MIIDSHIVEEYLAGGPTGRFRDEWCFGGGHPPYAEPEGSERERVREVYRQVLDCAGDFSPVNRAAWDLMFPEWREQTAGVELLLIVGYPEPYDAVSTKDPQGGEAIILDMLRWTAYLGHIKEAAENMLTHELTHALIALRAPEVVKDGGRADYIKRLDALAFNEGFAHLLSFKGLDLDRVDWSLPEYAAVWQRSRRRLKEALDCRDPGEQERLIYEGTAGRYFDKFLCMAGMFYLEEIWAREGIEGLEREFARGHSGFAKRCAGCE